MGHGWDFINKLMDAKLEIRTESPPVTNNYISNHYYIIEGDKIIQLTPDEFKRASKDKRLVANKTRFIENLR